MRRLFRDANEMILDAQTSEPTKLSGLAEEIPEIREIDLNPIIALLPDKVVESWTRASVWRQSMTSGEMAERSATMFKKILAPIDLTDKHAPALDMASDLVRQSQGELVLLHVIEIIPGLPFEEDRAFYKRLEKKAREHLEVLGRTLAARSIAWRAEIVYGNRVSEVVRFAATAEADLIVLTSPRLDPNKPGADWGSLSYKIGILCQCPVLLVK